MSCITSRNHNHPDRATLGQSLSIGLMPPVRSGLDASDEKQTPTPITAYLARLIIWFGLWKALLLTVVVLSPGPGYDTSTQLLIKQDGPPSGLQELVLRLTRWDGLYFATNSAVGYTYEQQWAFSWAGTRLSSFLANVLPLPATLAIIAKHSLAGIIISLAAHLGAVILLFLLADAFLLCGTARRRQVAFAAAVLHIVSPAGVFLIAPYSESLYAFLSFAGALFYLQAIQARSHGAVQHDAAWTVSAGIAWGLACTVRGNGLLNGTTFAWDLAGMILAFSLGDRTLHQLVRMAATIIAGLCIAAGYAGPQVIAYREYCQPESTRPWCQARFPSIYSWVQEHYWDVGFLKYWTFGNLPLFVMAAPMLLLLLITGYGALHHGRSLLMSLDGEERPTQRNSREYQTKRLIFRHISERLAVPQLLLAILAMTSFHVQIINRISSGYALWYVVLAIAIYDASPTVDCGHTRAEHYFPLRHIGGSRTRLIVRAMVIYAIVQAGLYASFLPPA